MQTCVIFNPSARGEKAQALCSRLETLYPDCAWRRTTQAGQAREFAAAAVRENFQKIVAAGGDGTVNEVINGIGDVPGSLASTCFGVLPLGTVNVYAREIGLPRRLDRAIEVVRRGRTMTIDLGCAEYTANGRPQQRLFIQLAGAGLDSRAIDLVSWELKKKLGAFAYVVAGLKAMVEKQPVITVEGGSAVAGELILIGNGRFYGGSFPIFPAASLQDGLLNFFVLPKVTWLKMLFAGPGLLTGNLSKFCSALQLSAASAKLTSPDRVILQLDGENVCDLPVTISVRPKALQVIVP